MILKKYLVDRDRLMSANRTQVAEACVSVFDRVQNWPKHTQVLGLAAAFLLTCDASGIPAQDAFSAVQNLMHDPETSTRLERRFQAMRYHLRTEVLA